MARKAERKAQQKAVDAYMKQWKKLKRIEGIQERKLGTRTKREVEDQFGDNASYESKRLAMKADKLGKVLNKLQPQFKEDADAYNRRYDEFQRQLNNQPVSAEFLNEKRSEAEAKYQNLREAREAREAADRARKDQSSAMNPIPGMASGKSQSSGNMKTMNPIQEMEEIAAQVMSLNTGAYYGPATSWRKTLPAHEQAAKDFNQLGDKVAGNKQYQQTAAEYKELADRLKNRLRREQAPVKQQGLLSSELASNAGPLANEGIR